MISQYFEKCVAELKSTDFKSIYFLKSAAILAQNDAARVQSLLLYSFFALSQERLPLALKCIQQALEINPKQLITSMLIGMKGAILTQMQKYSQAIQYLKESIQAAWKASQNEYNYIRSFFPFCMSRSWAQIVSDLIVKNKNRIIKILETLSDKIKQLKKGKLNKEKLLCKAKMDLIFKWKEVEIQHPISILTDFILKESKTQLKERIQRGTTGQSILTALIHIKVQDNLTSAYSCEQQ